MIVESQAKVIGEVTEVATKVEIYCPNCGRDVDETELAAKKCNDCGSDLSKPDQSIAIVVANLSAGGETL